MDKICMTFPPDYLPDSRRKLTSTRLTYKMLQIWNEFWIRAVFFWMIMGMRGDGARNPEGFHKGSWRDPEDSLRNPQGTSGDVFKAPLVVRTLSAPWTKRTGFVLPLSAVAQTFTVPWPKAPLVVQVFCAPWAKGSLIVRKFNTRAFILSSALLSTIPLLGAHQVCCEV